MQKNLGYVIPNIVIPDVNNMIGYWYLGSTPLGFRATGTMWTIGEDHYWYCDGVKTSYLAEIPVEAYDARFDTMIEGYTNQWNKYFTNTSNEWENYFADKQSQFSSWFDNVKNQLDSDAAGHLQNEVDALFLETINFVNKETITREDGTIVETLNNGCYIEAIIDKENNMTRRLYNKDGVLLYTHTLTFNPDGSITEQLLSAT